MKRILIKPAFLVYLASLMLLWACNENGGIDTSSDNIPLQLEFSTNASTKAPQSLTKFRLESKIGISIFPTGGYENHKDDGVDGCTHYAPIPEYRRILATQKMKYNADPNNYFYLPEGFTEPSTILYLKKKEGKVDLYAFYPYTKVTDFSKIPFELGEFHQSTDTDPTNTQNVNLDYMIADEGVLTIDPETASGTYLNNLTVPIKFKHITTQLEFNFDISFFGQDLLPRITIRCPGKIGTSGTYSYYDGSITVSDYVDSFDFTGIYAYARPNSTKNWTQGFMIPPIEVAADDPTEFEIEIKFNPGANPTPVQTKPYKFKLNELSVTGSDGVTRYGLLAGHKYAIKLKIDNFIKYTGSTPELQEWEQESLELPI